MIKKLLFSILLISSSYILLGQNFNKYFNKGSLRIDYIHSATFNDELFSVDNYFYEPYWGGSQINLIDTFDYGAYKFEAFDSTSNTLIYSRNFSTLCGEWKYTEEAKTIWRSFSESVIMPFPRATIKVKFYKRLKNQKWELWSEIYVNPKNYMISPDLKTPIKSFKIHDSGDPATKLDIVLLAEGYTQSEMQKFMNDAQRFAKYLLECDPFKQYESDINIWAVPSVSKESGTDIPGKGVYKNTLFDSHFYTFGTERYLNTTNNVAIRNVAANAPYDQIYILVNTDKYGGAGIYNFYSICTADDKYSDFVFTHEFGHAFAGLADEYYTSDVGVEDFYDLQSEPWEPNITTLVDFDKKWKSMVADSTPIPTPDIEENANLVGAFEGGGYIAKGIYRPKHDCSMKSIRYNDFCPVCTKAIIDRIKFYSR